MVYRVSELQEIEGLKSLERLYLENNPLTDQTVQQLQQWAQQNNVDVEF